MVPRRIVLILIAVAFCTLFLGAGQDNPTPATPAPPKEVTYNRDVAPIFYKNCVTCHRPNDIAPMSLITYKDARPWARRFVSRSCSARCRRGMPIPRSAISSTIPRLSDADIATIDAWVRTGAREGDPKDLPPAPVFAEGWHIKPDRCIHHP